MYTRNGMVEASGYKIDVRDTTGAGDSFIGAFLYCLLNDEVEDLESVSDDTLRNYLVLPMLMQRTQQQKKVH